MASTGLYVQRSSLSRRFANSYGVQVSNNLCVDIHVCGRHYVRKNLGVAWEQGYWFHTPLGEKWSGWTLDVYAHQKWDQFLPPKRLTLTDSPCQRRPISGGPPCMTSLCHYKRSLRPVSSCGTSPTVERLSEKLVDLWKMMSAGKEIRPLYE